MSPATVHLIGTIGFILMYGLLNWITFRRFQAAEIFSNRLLAALGLFMLSMIIGPNLVPTMDWAAFKPFSNGYAFVVYLWLVFVYLMFFFPLALGGGKALINGLSLLTRGSELWSVSPKNEARFYLALCFFLVGYGFYEAEHPILERVEFKHPAIPPGKSIRIVAFADLHLGMPGNRSRLEKMLALAGDSRPDLLVSLGDLVDLHLEDPEGVAERFQKFQPPLGKIAVFGNHEAYVGVEVSTKITQTSGFTLLRNKTLAVTPFLTIVGVDDRTFHTASDPAIVDRLAAIATGPFVILLRHPPLVATGSRDLIDLQLSGHMHHGQIFPNYYLLRSEFGFPSGLSRLGTRAFLYVTRGVGTFGPPLRLFAPPEITIIDLLPPKAL